MSDPFEAIRAHVEKHVGKERATFSVAGIKALLDALAASMRDEGEASARQLWQELLEKDDRTSPAEYPDMALITFDEFAAALRRNAEPPVEAPAPSEEPVASETDRLVRASQWLQDRWGEKHPNTAHIRQLADYEAFLASPAVAPVAITLNMAVASTEMQTLKPCEKHPERYCNCEGFYPACRSTDEVKP